MYQLSVAGHDEGVVGWVATRMACLKPRLHARKMVAQFRSAKLSNHLPSAKSVKYRASWDLASPVLVQYFKYFEALQSFLALNLASLRRNWKRLHSAEKLLVQTRARSLLAPAHDDRKAAIYISRC